jgi:hypothetical protein
MEANEIWSQYDVPAQAPSNKRRTNIIISSRAETRENTHKKQHPQNQNREQEANKHEQV